MVLQEVSELMPNLQSGFRKGHSMETVLLQLLSDFDNSGHEMVLALLNVSTVFDMVDHVILVTCLSTSYAFMGLLLEWLRSFVDDQKMMVKIGLRLGLPSCSVSLRALFSTLYTQLLVI